LKKLSIIYRAYPGISKKPIIDFKDKDEMMAFSLTSLKKALKNVKYEFIFLSDNCTKSQINIVQDIMCQDAHRFTIKQLSGIGNMESFRAQMNTVNSTSFDHILILEDDYFVDKYDIDLNLKQLSENLDIHYSTFYYSIDSETTFGDMKIEQKELDNLTLTFLPSTTLTFFAKKDILLEDLNYFMEFSNGTHDTSLWLRLTGKFLWFLPKIRKPLFWNNKYLFLSVVKRYFTHMINYKVKKRKLAFIGLGRSTHLESEGVFNEFNLIKYITLQFSKWKMSINK
jgi:hypothetical protein